MISYSPQYCRSAKACSSKKVGFLARVSVHTKRI